MKEKLKGKVKRIRFSVNIIELFYSKQITYYTSSAQPLPSTFQTDADSNVLLDMINEFEQTHGPPTDDSILVAASLPHTIRHQYLIDEVTGDFITALSKFPNNKWKRALNPVEHKGVTGKRNYPRILVEVGGLKTPSNQSTPYLIT